MNGSVTYDSLYFGPLDRVRTFLMLEAAVSEGQAEYREAQEQDKTPGSGRRRGWAKARPRRRDPDGF